MARPNQYGGICYRCGGRVAAGAGFGHFEKFPGQRWPKMAGTRDLFLIEHASCHRFYAGRNTHYLYAPDDADSEVIEPFTDSRYTGHQPER